MNPDLQTFLQAWTGGADVSDAERARLLQRLETDAVFRTECAEEIRLLGLIKAMQTPSPRWLNLQDTLGLSAATPAEITDDDFANRVLHLVQNEPRKPSKVRWFAWRPPHKIQKQTIDPLLAAVEAFLENGNQAAVGR